jgi:pSer/pThr/pTyr-binding forkhead associated (FHA) protein
MIHLPKIFSGTQFVRQKAERVTHHRFPESVLERKAEFQVRIEPKNDSEAAQTKTALIRHFPIAIGRVSRDFSSVVRVGSAYFVEDRAPHNVSRRHCVIEWRDGWLEVVDQASRLGTIVNDRMIGRDAGVSRERLRMGENIVVLGCPKRGQQFRVTVLRQSD